VVKRFFSLASADTQNNMSKRIKLLSSRSQAWNSSFFADCHVRSLKQLCRWRNMCGEHSDVHFKSADFINVQVANFEWWSSYGV
jgi:hypothetical protein